MRATMDRSVPFSVILLVLVFGFVKVDEYRLKKKKKKKKKGLVGIKSLFPQAIVEKKKKKKAKGQMR